MSQDKAATFGAMVRASIGIGEVPGVSFNAGQGGGFRLPMATAALVAGDEAGGRERVGEGVTWLGGDSADSPIMGRISIIPTTQSRGKILIGATLPGTSMQGERMTATLGRGTAFPTTPAPVSGDLFRFLQDATGLTAIDEDGAALTTASVDDTFKFTGATWQRQAAVFAEHEFTLDSTVEAKSEISQQVLVQSGEQVLDDLLEAHRIGLNDRLLEQVLSGDNVGNNLSGVASRAGIGGGTFQLADRGGSVGFQDGEDIVEDAGGRRSGMAWALGKNLSTSARKTAIEPGGSRRAEEQGRLVLSGLPAQRITEGLAGTTGLCADWGLVYVPILSELVVVSDIITVPGDVRITSRLACASPIISHPATVYALTQA